MGKNQLINKELISRMNLPIHHKHTPQRYRLVYTCKMLQAMLSSVTGKSTSYATTQMQKGKNDRLEGSAKRDEVGIIGKGAACGVA